MFLSNQKYSISGQFRPSLIHNNSYLTRSYKTLLPANDPSNTIDFNRFIDELNAINLKKINNIKINIKSLDFLIPKNIEGMAPFTPLTHPFAPHFTPLYANWKASFTSPYYSLSSFGLRRQSIPPPPTPQLLTQPKLNTKRIIIPCIIYQTWHTKELPPLMNSSVSNLRKVNPGFSYRLFDDNDCRNFIIEHFETDVVNAYDALVPGAFKADLWRYCVLFKTGGIYIDIKYTCYNQFKLIELCEAEHFVLDADKNGIYNAFMVCLPNNQKLWSCIQQIVKNVSDQYYGNHSLEITGPLLLAKYFTQNEKRQLDMYHTFYETFKNRVVIYNGKHILISYPGYLTEYDKTKKTEHYSQLWNERKVYNPPSILFKIYNKVTKQILGINSWITTSRNSTYENNILKTYLQTNGTDWKYNEMEILPMLKDINLINDDGLLKYTPSKQEDERIMKELFPTYVGECIPSICITSCTILSVDIPKYNAIRNETIDILNTFNIPSINTFLGYTPQTKSSAKFYNNMVYKENRIELALGMLEIFDNFVNSSITGDEWMLYFEDDVRPINISMDEDLHFLYNIPSNAELIRPYIGKNEWCSLKDVTYNRSFGGGLNHAFYISVSGCKKVLHYALKYGWRYVCDIDIYKLAKFCGKYPTGYDGWGLGSCNGNNDITELLQEDEKIYMYQISNCIFNQTSNTCV